MYMNVLIITGYLLAAHLTALSISAIASFVWAWVDDKETVGFNPYISILAKIRGCYYSAKEAERLIRKGYGARTCHEDLLVAQWMGNNQKSHGYGEIREFLDRYKEDTVKRDGFWLVSFILLLSPTIIWVSFLFYPIVLSAVSFWLIANLARYARRHKKLFDKHLKDDHSQAVSSDD